MTKYIKNEKQYEAFKRFIHNGRYQERLEATVGSGYLNYINNINQLQDWDTIINSSAYYFVFNDYAFEATINALNHGVSLDRIVLVITDKIIWGYFQCFVYPSWCDKFLADDLITAENGIFQNIVYLNKEVRNKIGKKGQPVKDTETIYMLENEANTKVNLFDKPIGLLMNNPFSLSNEIVEGIKQLNLKIIDAVEIRPLRGLKANEQYKHVVPGTIIHSVDTTQFAGAWTTPITFKLDLSQEMTRDSFELFELHHNYTHSNPKEPLSKAWDLIWHYQETHPATFLSHDCNVNLDEFVNYDVKVTSLSGVYTPNIMLNNGPKTITNNDKSFKLDDRYYKYNFLNDTDLSDFLPQSRTAGSSNQTMTVWPEGWKQNVLNWEHQAELNNGTNYRLTGLFSILLRNMNKPTGCPFPYAFPHVSFADLRTDRDILEEIFKAEGVMDEKLRNAYIDYILHSNDDLIVRKGK